MAIAAPAMAQSNDSGGLAGAGLAISWSTVDCGGGESTSGMLAIHGTIGQPDGNEVVMAAGTLELRGGFWVGFGEPLDPCPADISPYPAGNGVVNIDDYTDVILFWGTVGPQGDVTGDGMVNIDDYTAVVLAWGDC